MTKQGEKNAARTLKKTLQQLRYIVISFPFANVITSPYKSETIRNTCWRHTKKETPQKIGETIKQLIVAFSLPFNTLQGRCLIFSSHPHQSVSSSYKKFDKKSWAFVHAFWLDKKKDVLIHLHLKYAFNAKPGSEEVPRQSDTKYHLTCSQFIRQKYFLYTPPPKGRH